jgi:hypothetical protein
MWYYIDLADLKSSLEFSGVQTHTMYCNNGILLSRILYLTFKGISEMILGIIKY